MGGGGGGHSESTTSNVTTVSTANVADAFNQTVTNMRNLSEVGNVNITTPSEGGTTAITIIGVGAVALFALFISKRG